MEMNNQTKNEHSTELDNGSVKLPSPAPQSSRQWIESRYGPIKFASHSVMYDGKGSSLATVITAAVPGVAVGVGATEECAITALYGDLHGYPGDDSLPI